MKYLKLYEDFNNENNTLILIHNKDKAPYLGKKFGQNVEPAGYYCIEYKGIKTSHNYEIVEYTYSKPLIINVNEDTLIKWKYDLSKRYKATGVKLTKKLMEIGYDIIITKYDDNATGEIIILDTSKIKNLNL
jgi:hypothetical protein